MPARLQDATWEEVLLDLVAVIWQLTGEISCEDYDGVLDNPISCTHTLEQMLLEIGEPVYRWKRKEEVE